MGQANRRGSYEERKAQGIERKDAERIEREKLEAIRKQERIERTKAENVLFAKSNQIRPKGKSRTAHRLALLGMMGVIGHI